MTSLVLAPTRALRRLLLKDSPLKNECHAGSIFSSRVSDLPVKVRLLF